MRNTVIVLGLLFVLGVGVLQGCVAVVVGAAAGTVAYVKGDLEAVETANIDKVYNATLKAMDQLKLPVIQKGKDALSATVVARDAQDKKITVKSTSTADGATKISIRVGVFGDKTKSLLIYEQIKKNL